VEDALARVTVASGGAQIDPIQAQTLTEPFRRLGRGAGGFGLGLSIVRSVSEAHGGQTELIARPAGGLEVRVAIPAAPVPAVTTKETMRALTKS
jgi:signal transduction histidine kinase